MQRCERPLSVLRRRVSRKNRLLNARSVFDDVYYQQHKLGEE
jgi:hypothetical protein